MFGLGTWRAELRLKRYEKKKKTMRKKKGEKKRNRGRD
jgi:hypothetical protein